MCVETPEQGSFISGEQFEESHAEVYSHDACFPILST